MINLKQQWATILDAFSADGCGMCDRPTASMLCSHCQTQLQTCALADPTQFWQDALPLFAWGRYVGALRRAIAALKYENQPQLARFLGAWMGQQWLASPMAQRSGRSLIVVPVAANAAKKKRRGYDQAELLAASFCQYTRLPLDLHRVIRTEDTVPMFGLSLAERQQNVKGKFQLHPRFRPSGKQAKPSILLLDDIYTTGSTLNAIAQLCRQHQMSVYGAITLAKAGLSDPT
ncbi:MAG: ComF family protein [Leptolyngbyaceae bacterium]|nr:ComF family protein [Leptolyngbyaceae bacterium]